MRSLLSHTRLVLLFLIGTMVACVDPISFDTPPPQLQTVIEGFISDNPGPYTIKVSEGFSLDAIEPESRPITGLSITLYDDMGVSEAYTEVSPGVYETAGLMQGEIGRSYHIRVETPEGDVFESSPDELRPTGALEDITFQYEQRSIETKVSIVPADVFNVFIDGNAGPEEESFTRWRFKGTYEVFTYPERHEITPRTYRPYPAPLECSGWILLGGTGPPKFKQIGPCECCTCFVTQFEDKPQLSDNLLVSNGAFRNIKVAEVPITEATFYNKYFVQIEQMSMTREAFEFFRLVRAQKEDAASFFQPTFGEIIGNIKPVNNERSVVGYFWSTSIDRMNKFIYRDDIPYPMVPIRVRPGSCLLAFPNSSLEKPQGWD